jgi:hypothetical protein
MIDVSKIRVGDEVTVRAAVDDIRHADSTAPVSVSFNGVGHTHWIRASDIATHTPKPRDFKPGDRVTHANHGGLTFNVIASNSKGALWVEDAGGWNFVESAALFRHTDESE